MTPSQKSAAAKLEEALKACASAKLGVYVYDGSVFVCPAHAGVKDPRWQDSPMEVCEDLGRVFYVPGLVCDGGAGC